MADHEFGQMAGFRYDINLDERWWHRLAKVLYGIVLAITATIVFFVWDDIKPEAKRRDVKIANTLGEAFRIAPPTAENVVAEFSKGPGQLGILKADGSISYLSTYDLDKSWCTPDSSRYLGETADCLAKREYYRNPADPIALQASLEKRWGPGRRLR